MKPANRSFTLQVLGLVILAFIVHSLVLQFIFPGYYSPLIPHHSDFYISKALAYSPNDFFQYRYLGYSRPFALFIMKWIGFLGLRGSILFTITIVMFNCALSALFITRLLKIEFKWPVILAYGIYCYLLFTQPYFYTFYTHDVLAHFSYFFLITGGLIAYSSGQAKPRRAAIILFVFSILAFLCKETYAFMACFLALLATAFRYRHMPFAKAVYPFISVAGALIVVIVFNLSIKSIFIDFKSGAGDPYHIVFSPPSILKEISLYASEAINYLNAIVIALTAFVGAWLYRRGNKFAAMIIAACFVATVFAWLPNALIPNHHGGGYSFNGAYLLYLPVFGIALINLGSTEGYLVSGTLTIAALLSPLVSTEAYKKQGWVLEQETTQRNLLKSLPVVFDHITPHAGTQKILVTGLTMPFYPFHHPRALKNYPNFDKAVFDVVDYSAGSGPLNDLSVTFIKPAAVEIGKYSSIWMFAADGTLLSELQLTEPWKKVIADRGIQDLLVFPSPDKNKQLVSVLNPQQPQ